AKRGRRRLWKSCFVDLRFSLHRQPSSSVLSASLGKRAVALSAQPRSIANSTAAKRAASPFSKRRKSTIENAHDVRGLRIYFSRIALAADEVLPEAALAASDRAAPPVDSWSGGFSASG